MLEQDCTHILDAASRNVFKSSIFLLSRLISFKMFSWSTGEKWKSSLLIIFLLIRFILGCYSNFLIAISSGFSFALIPSERIAFSNKLINEFATLDSSEIISRFSTKDIFGKDVTLSDKKGSTVYQNSLLSVTFVKSSIFFFLSGFSFTNIHKSQDCRGRGRVFL